MPDSSVPAGWAVIENAIKLGRKTVHPTIGAHVGDLRRRIKEVLPKVAEVGFQAVEIPAAEGEISPAALSTSGRRHLARFVEGLGLSLSVLSADLPGRRLTDPKTAQERVERTCAVIQLARDLHVPVVTSETGVLTHPDTGAPSPLALEGLARIGEVADGCAVTFALRTPQETGDRTASLLRMLDCPAIGVGFDPAG
ncbi:MAG: hypothetical protein D6788_00560, partial [Planctomycetota bacterium]